MKKYIVSLFICANVLCVMNTLSCPYSFSNEDQRPFFEQYEMVNNPVTPTEKETKS